MNKMIGIVLIVVGLISLIFGLVFYFTAKEYNSTFENNDIKKAEVAVSHKQNTKENNDYASSNDGNKKKGIEFEEFIVQKFNHKYFTIEDWRSDKGVNGIYPKSSLKPDFEIEFKLGEQRHRFAVECKWRKDLYKGGLQIANQDQLDRYRKYEQETGNPVFMAIGYGKEPSSPARLFILPLSKVNDNFLEIDYLTKFEKQDISKKFYYNYEEGELK